MKTINHTKKTFEVSYCYGGRYRGESKNAVKVQAESKEGALNVFKNTYRYEDIYSVTELPNAEKNIDIKLTVAVQSLRDVLVAILEANDTKQIDLKDNDLNWINDDLDYITVKFFGTEPDGDRQAEYANENPKTISAAEAIELLQVRINNTLETIL